MSTLFSLDGRLSVCAGLVRQGARLADVGTDHAYLPVWLAKNGVISSAVASDVREKPLASGAENIERYDCADIVSTRLCNGLDGISANEADDIVMAGMGGELICDIIGRAPWLKDPEKRLILQPMTKAHTLRQYLSENGFELLSETPCAHGGKSYTVIHAAYTGNAFTPSMPFCYIGKLENDGSLARDYVQNILSKLVKKRRGVSLGGGDTTPYDEVIAEIKNRFGVDIHDDR